MPLRDEINLSDTPIWSIEKLSNLSMTDKMRNSAMMQSYNPETPLMKSTSSLLRYPGYFVSDRGKD